MPSCPQPRVLRRLLPVLALISLIAFACRRPGDLPREQAGTAPGAVFRDVSARLRLSEVPQPGRDDGYFMPESLAAGGAWLDYDGDGDLDIYVLRGAARRDGADAEAAARNRLLRQEADGSFVDVTDASGAGDAGYGMGVAVGDLDNDGDPDLYVSNFGPDALYRNEGDGTFRDVSAAAGIDNPRWGASVGLLDFDRDGRLDIFVTNYVDWDPTVVCTDRAGRPDYCGPAGFAGVPDVLYRNRGDGTFRDVSAAAGIAAAAAPGLGVVSADFNGDGVPDLYVANDGAPNHLWLNTGRRSFEDAAAALGAAVNALGKAEAGMGVDLGDVDGDEDLDLFVSHLRQETNTLYRSNGSDGFYDDSLAAGVAGLSVPHTGFGSVFLDQDNDGDLDLAVVNGRVTRGPLAERIDSLDPWAAYAEPNLLLENDGRGRFRDASRQAGPFAARTENSRGLAVGDLDRDGALDLLVTQAGGSARIFRNELSGGRHWAIVELIDGNGPREGVGARVTVVAGDRRQIRVITSQRGYLSASDLRAHFGLGDATRIEELLVIWPDGGTTRLFDLPADRVLTIVR